MILSLLLFRHTALFLFMVIAMELDSVQGSLKLLSFLLKGQNPFLLCEKRAAAMILYTAFKIINQRICASVNGKGDVWKKSVNLLTLHNFSDLSGNNSHCIWYHTSYLENVVFNLILMKQYPRYYRIVIAVGNWQDIIAIR